MYVPTHILWLEATLDFTICNGNSTQASDTKPFSNVTKGLSICGPWKVHGAKLGAL